MNPALKNVSKLLFVGLLLLLAVYAFGRAPSHPALAEIDSPNDTTVVSTSSDGALANGSSYNPAISSNNQVVAFQSSATNLVANDSNGEGDVFVHDLASGNTEVVSKNSDGVLGNGLSSVPKLAADGRYVVFVSLAENLVSGDDNGTWDVFLHDRQTETTELASVNSSGVPGNSDSSQFAVSDDGRFIVFDSSADNLVANDTNGSHDLFLRDRMLSTTIRLSANSGGDQTLGAVYPGISGSGDYVFFRSSVDDLVEDDTNGTSDIFVYELQTGSIDLISRATNGTIANGFSDRPAISDDGRYVVFLSEADNLVDGDTNGHRDAFWHDRQTGRTIRVSVDSNGVQGNDAVVDAFVSVSANGRYAAYSSLAGNLVPDDVNDAADVFIHDLATRTTEIVSKHSDGSFGNSWSSWVDLADDASHVAFVSDADNLVDADTNDAVDAFVHEPVISSEAVLAINYETGAAGSFFTVAGFGFPPNADADISINGNLLGSVLTDQNGNLTFILSTADADEGSYVVTATVNPSAATAFVIDADEPVHPQEGSAPSFAVPAGIAFAETVLLPVVLRP